MDLEQLRERYVEFQMEGNLDLEEFLDKVKAGEFGAVDRAVVAQFLDALEADILANIDTMLQARPDLAERAEEAREEQAAWVQRLRRKYL